MPSPDKKTGRVATKVNNEYAGGEKCQLPQRASDPEVVRKILAGCKTVAIVGLSAKPERDSYRVAAYLKEHGFEIIPVNPQSAEILGEKCYKTLADIPFRVDVVDVFRKPSALPALAGEIINARPKAAWFQIGVVSNSAAKKITDAGIGFVQNVCMKTEHQRLSPA